MKVFNLMNSKGISVLFLVIAMLLMIIIGYVFSYLIPMKQKTVRFPIYSTQAFFIAQSGVEFAIRYCEDQGWRGATDGTLDLEGLDNIQRTVVNNGRFTINYNINTDGTLTSTGEIINSSERRTISVTRFTRFLRLIFNTPDPCRRPPAAGLPPGAPSRNNAARFYIQNVRRTDVTLNSFSASWAGGAGLLQRIYMDEGGGWDLKYNGNYATGSPPPIVNFNQPAPNNQQTIAPAQSITILIYWDFNLSGDTNIVITFYSTTGDKYTFNLDPQGDELPTC